MGEICFSLPARPFSLTSPTPTATFAPPPLAELFPKPSKLVSLRRRGRTSSTRRIFRRCRTSFRRPKLCAIHFRRRLPNRAELIFSLSQFIKQQDKLFRDQHESERHVRVLYCAASHRNPNALLEQQGNFEEAEQGLRSQISTLTEELARQKVCQLLLTLRCLCSSLRTRQSNNADVEARYRREQQLMLSAWHELGMRSMREGVAAAGASGARGGQPSSWLAQQRARSNGKGLVSSYERGCAGAELTFGHITQRNA